MADKDQLEIDLDIPDDKEPKEKKKAAPKAAEEEPVVVTEPEKPAASAVTTPDVAVEKLRAQLQRAEGRARVAETSVQSVTAQAEKYAKDAREANLNMVKGAIDTLKGQQGTLESSYAAALSAQDFTGAAKIQRQMSENAAKLVSLETGKDAMEAEAAKGPIIQPVAVSDPVEQFARQLSQKSASWVRSHPEYVTDPRLNRKMIAAHELALADGEEADSDGYFDAIEKTLNLRKAPVREDDEEIVLSEAAAPAKPRSSSPAAAPVTRSGTGNGQRQNVVVLTPEEREIAELNGMSPREYAIQKQKLIKEGKLH